MTTRSTWARVRAWLAGRLPSGRASRIVALAAVTGALTGVLVAGFEIVTTEVLLDWLLTRNRWEQAVAPGIGLLLGALCLRYVAPNVTPRTGDEFVRVFHDRSARASLRPLPGRLLAGMTTIGFGGALGLEGPAIYAGSTIGDSIQHRLSRFFAREDAKILLTAGAAAGVAAVFKTPATGVIFALEAPYRDDVTRRALLPALVAAATSYIVFVAIVGTEPVFPLFGTRPTLELSGIVGAVLVGVLAGLGGRLFAGAVRWAKRMVDRYRLRWRILVAAAILGALVLVGHAVFDDPLTLGPGYEAVEWAADPDRGAGLIALLLAMRVVATVTTLGGNGTGGLFIPLAVQGVLLGRLVGEAVGQPESSLYPTIGLAAFLGAGYRAPIAAVMFVAESTAGDFFVVPALIAAATSQLVAGVSSVSPYQRTSRRGHLEERFTMPISSVLRTDTLTVPPDATVEEFVWVHVLGNRERSVPVVDGAAYLGTCLLDDVSELDRTEWATTEVAEVMRDDLPAALPTWRLRDAVSAMEQADVDVLAVTDVDGTFIGVVDSSEILKLEEILDQTS